MATDYRDSAANSPPPPPGASPAYVPLSSARLRGFLVVTGVWLLLAAGLIGFGWQNRSVPGLYYDEAIFGGLAKDFLAGAVRGPHTPGVEFGTLFGRPFPILVISYLGAVKSWMLVPVFKVFGATMAVLRMANLAFTLVGLWVFMVWVWRLLGAGAAAAAGALLATDPAFFFDGELDWGSAVPSLLCRFAGFALFLSAWRKRRARHAFLAGLILGLGFLNKIDFALILIGVALAGACVFARPFLSLVRANARWAVAGAAGFFLGAGPMIWGLPKILLVQLTVPQPAHPEELAEKLATLRAMYDGSYFYRLMNVGGLFDHMYLAPSPVWTPLAIVLIASLVVGAVAIIRRRADDGLRRLTAFVLLAGGFVTAGVICLPRAVRIYHAILVIPFPHLAITLAGAVLWRQWGARSAPHLAGRGVLILGLAGLLVLQTLAIGQTERLIRQTRGRGWWSDAIMNLCDQVNHRTDLTIVSLDWGFNEQLDFLTEGAHLSEPVWDLMHEKDVVLPTNADYVYLVHSPDYTQFFYDEPLKLDLAQPQEWEVRPWRDHEGQVVFLSVRHRARGAAQTPAGSAAR